MKDELIKFDTAMLAQTKGFDEYCSAWYTEPDKLEYSEMDDIKNSEDENSHFLPSAPTQSLLQRWLRETHKIRIFVENKTAGDFGFIIYTLNPDKTKIAGIPWIRNSYFTLHFNTYEEALEKGLLNALKLIKDGEKE